MTTEPRTPLTLEYEPEGLENDHESHPVIIAEPSFAHPGRIFVGIHPLRHIQGVQRAGVHLLPEDARRVMEHLAKLLMEKPPEVPVEWQKRIENAAKRPRKKLQLRPEFRLEFKIGRLMGVIGTSNDG